MLDRDIIDAEEVAEDDEEENGFLKAFKVFIPLTFLLLLLVFSGSVLTDFDTPVELVFRPWVASVFVTLIE